MKVNIDEVIADIESTIAEHGVTANVDDWIAEAELLAKSVTISELNRLCDVHLGIPFVVEPEYAPQCLGCTEVSLWLFARMGTNGYELFLQCSTCKLEGEVSIPFRVCGKERVVTTLAVYLVEQSGRLVEEREKC